MPHTTGTSYDELVRQSEELLRSAGEILPAFAPQDGRVTDSTARRELADFEEEPVHSADGSVEIRISEDCMTATARFSPPIGSGKQIDLADVQELLGARGVRFGIDWSAVKSAILACNTSRTALDVEVARGRKPSDELPARLSIEQSLLKKPVPGDTTSQAVDFKAISSIAFVKKGDVLARVTPRIEGVSGIDVTGATVAYATNGAETLKPGKNTVMESSAVRAGCDGRFMSRGDSFWVSEVLEIPGDVDFSTGHIDFAGDVIIHGQVKQGFKVKAGGSLYCGKLIDASEIVCGGDLETGQGILGRMQGTVKVGGTVRARFIENCYLEAQGDVVVSTGCLNSVVCTLGMVSTGPKGVIIGGRITAQKGVSAFQIGSSAGARTEVQCGIDFMVQQKLTWIRDQNIALALKLRQVAMTLTARRGADGKLLDLQGKLKTAIHRMNDSARTLVASLHKDEGATVSVRGDIHHGAYIEICNVSLVISGAMSRVRFKLDKAFGIISPERRP